MPELSENRISQTLVTRLIHTNNITAIKWDSGITIFTIFWFHFLNLNCTYINMFALGRELKF